MLSFLAWVNGADLQFGVSSSLTWNYTGPDVIPMMSDSDNSAMVGGYEIGFILLPC